MQGCCGDILRLRGERIEGDVGRWRKGEEEGGRREDESSKAWGVSGGIRGRGEGGCRQGNRGVRVGD